MQFSVITLILSVSTMTSAVPTAIVEKRGLECSGTGAYYVCAANGFRGYCSSDPCNKQWCPDFTPKTCDKKTTLTPPPPAPVDIGKGKGTDKPVEGVCPAGTGYYQVCSNGFRGCCKQDACGLGWCPGNQVLRSEKSPRTSVW